MQTLSAANEVTLEEKWITICLSLRCSYECEDSLRKYRRYPELLEVTILLQTYEPEKLEK
jgi:hypothetical protein